jgi:hypothetical protein
MIISRCCEDHHLWDGVEGSRIGQRKIWARMRTTKIVASPSGSSGAAEKHLTQVANEIKFR